MRKYLETISKTQAKIVRLILVRFLHTKITLGDGLQPFSVKSFEMITKTLTEMLMTHVNDIYVGDLH